MRENVESIKNNYNINEILPLSAIALQKERVLLFFNKEQGVAYSLYTDGDVEHIDTWVDKKPWDRDPFLDGCSTVSRFEFSITNANILLIEKRYQGSIVRNLYLDQERLYKVINNYLYKVCVSPKEKIMIKRLENGYGN